RRPVAAPSPALDRGGGGGEAGALRRTGNVASIDAVSAQTSASGLPRCAGVSDRIDMVALAP
ncbi:MAG: hypothetical protein KGO01_21380, partial [Burkholderiales bacterium]|nr:hypothetical protein [Burkholderiales bacterium]